MSNPAVVADATAVIAAGNDDDNGATKLCHIHSAQ